MQESEPRLERPPDFPKGDMLIRPVAAWSLGPCGLDHGVGHSCGLRGRHKHLRTGSTRRARLAS